jgi:hypothetical protein
MEKTRTRPARALLRVLRAPAFVVGLWLAQMLLAKLLASTTRAAAQAGMRGFTWVEDDHRLRALAELLIDEPAIVATILAALTASAILAGLFSVLAAPVILIRLDGQRSWSAILGAAAAKLPAVLVQTGYGVVFRAACTGLAGLATLLGAGALPLVLLLGSFPILVLDRARAAVVLDGERPYHPKTFLRAVVQVGKRPLWWASGTVIEALKIGVGVAALMLVVQSDGSSASLWWARGAGLLAVLFGLWRVSLAVEREHDHRASSTATPRSSPSDLT